ncbi:sugar transferase [Patescibacteria group bacterium]|nr:sugar transferase [Patescibacteria group bacterium]MBU1778270.1 sugar transferase [Patescibacteria group bacterium]MBU1987571.1 sugar transferase [Patescibacteria group bacterium]
MKRSELFFSFLLVPLDFVMIALAGISAYYIRFAQFTAEIRPIIFDLPFIDYFKVLLFIAFLWIIVFAFAGLYNIRSARKLVKEIYRIILACSTGLMLIVVLIFMRRELFDSRFIVLAGWILAIFYISLARILIRWLQTFLFNYGIGVHKIILVGNSQTADSLIKEFSVNKNCGFQIVKRLRDFSMETGQNTLEFIKNQEVDEIIQSDPNLTKAEVLRLYNFADENHLIFKYAADLLGTKVLKSEVMEIIGIPIVEIKKTSLEGWGRIIKRIFDIIGSVILIIAFLPILAIIAILITLDSHGSIFYLDYRSGQYNKKFLFYKFRSMVAHLCDGEGPHGTKEGNKALRELTADNTINTRDSGPLHKIKDDPRITKVGMFIRKWSIDELPQLFNVLKGDMSLVGPRPHMTLETAQYESHHKKLLTIKPGITGLAQISGRSDLNFEEEVKLDTYYIENWSLLLDLSILLRTPIAVVKRRAVN